MSDTIRAAAPAVGKSEVGHEVESEAALVAIADEWARAIVSNDPARIAGFMADDWVIVSESGVTTRERFLAFVRSGQLSHSAMDRVSDPRIRTYGDTAVLSMRQTNTAHYQGQRFDADEWVTDVFVRRDRSWACVLSQITAVASAPTGGDS
ncbi:MAG: nuclear transport factor 2 family protein [Actinomycetota bacterium]|nr:nuclear transport factor 2 family protein [Actinomycetota bacterium]